MAEVISVSELNRYVKTLFDANDCLYDIALRGEITNYVQNARSGHCYFSLRDSACSVKAVMFRTEARRLAFRPEEGMRVVVRCRATLYERDGAFQIYVNDMFPDGLGAAQLALEQLKAKLEAEGLFAAEHKKKLPEYPRCIGVVTSKSGAALQDIRNVISRRWPAVKLLLCPVTVQGFEAAQQIAEAIRTLDKSGKVDEIIVARGGGSREDLWVFNAETIARAAYRCKVPLISAIGHEIDYTILDFVADQRAPTPSAAAELAVPDRIFEQQRLLTLQQNFLKVVQNRLEMCYNECGMNNLLLEQHSPTCALQKKEASLKTLEDTLRQQIAAVVQEKNRQLQNMAALAASLDPYRVLARGYTILQDPEGKLCMMEHLQPDDVIYVCDSARRAKCRVETVEEINESTQKL